jgi:putative SOS response-associated peptidase YedK
MMCGRFAFYSPAEAVTALFGTTAAASIPARYNIAPTQQIATIRSIDGADPELVMLRWGLVPFWAKDISIGNRMINARAETIAEKPSFRNALKKRRCLVLADGYYEWRREGEVKTPWYISRQDSQPMAFAGLWENWNDPQSGDSLQTATIITTEANDFLSQLHHRMPVILRPSQVSEWLDTTHELPQSTVRLQAWPVDRRVNNARNEGEDLIIATGDLLRA